MLYRLQFIDRARFMASSLSNLVNNFAEGINKIKCKHDKIIENVNLEELNTKIACAFLNIQI